MLTRDKATPVLFPECSLGTRNEAKSFPIIKDSFCSQPLKPVFSCEVWGEPHPLDEETTAEANEYTRVTRFLRRGTTDGNVSGGLPWGG